MEKKVGSLAYQLKLSAGLHQLHPVFNAVKLFPAPDDPIPGCHPNAPPLPILVNDEEEYEVEEILDSRMFQGKLQFKVKWKETFTAGTPMHQRQFEASTLSQQLIGQSTTSSTKEALYKNNQSNGRALEEEHRGEFGGICKQVVPPYLHAFEDVLSKASFDSLLECKKWDHAIKLLPNSAPSSCKVYPLVLREQDKLDASLQENLDSGCICLSKSSMASLVFFIKKKDGSL
ncbi:hypothetical protein E4T56_gene4624 [Termitomyces sp. T112]|nr:hypothetical protein E4T56_gene4624 [Termitomyces sp. T112]